MLNYSFIIYSSFPYSNIILFLCLVSPALVFPASVPYLANYYVHFIPNSVSWSVSREKLQERCRSVWCGLLDQMFFLFKPVMLCYVMIAKLVEELNVKTRTRYVPLTAGQARQKRIIIISRGADRRGRKKDVVGGSSGGGGVKVENKCVIPFSFLPSFFGSFAHSFFSFVLFFFFFFSCLLSIILIL